MDMQTMQLDIGTKTISIKGPHPGAVPVYTALWQHDPMGPIGRGETRSAAAHDLLAKSAG
jgi:hypothetical protein